MKGFRLMFQLFEDFNEDIVIINYRTTFFQLLLFHYYNCIQAAPCIVHFVSMLNNYTLVAVEENYI